MVVMVHHQPRWVCDICRYDMPAAGGAVLYNRASGARIFPQPLIVCGQTCASLAEGRLVAGEIVRLPWPAFVQSLTTVAGETWRAPTVSWWEWYDYERERRQLILAQLKAIAEAEGYLHDGR